VTAPEEYVLPEGGTVGQALELLRQNMLRLRMTRAGAPPSQPLHTVRGFPPHSSCRRSRKGEPARTKTSR